MSAPNPPRLSGLSRRLSLVLFASAGLALAALTAPPGSSAANAACGSNAPAASASADAAVASNIYGNELVGTEVHFDLAQITGATDLLSALAAGNGAAVHAAVNRIVFHPRWHIVRLRVLSPSGHLLADIGGPYIIAPVSGVLRYRGRLVGRFVMSVQDDTGFTKLETRFVGNPIAIYLKSKLDTALGASFPAAQPTAPVLTLGRVSYRVATITYNAFPSGTLTAVILVPPPSAALSQQPCAVVRASELERVALRFTHLHLLAGPLTQHYQEYAINVRTYTDAEVFVRAATKQLATSGGLGPTTLPSSGAFRYQGKSWLVFSFTSAPSTRVTLLMPTT